MRLADIRYIAFEGGGGKGIVYLGAIRALEAAGKLPLAKADREGSDGSKRLDGISGASAGAITVYFLALGMNADAIDTRTRAVNRSTGKPEFYAFYDDAQPGLYKGVAYKAGEGNVSGYVVDVPTVERERRDPTGFSEGVSIASDITVLKTGRGYADRAPAEAAAAKLYALCKFVFPLGALKLAARVARVRKKLRKLGASNQLMEKISEIPADLNKYFYSLLMDRGLFSGINLRTYLHYATVEELSYNFDVDISLEAAARLTYRDFFALTGNDLRIAGTNVTKGIPVYFSKDLTPDFPIVDSICMSMSIPFAFKPTLCEPWVDMSQPYESAHNQRYHGFFNDAGTLNNLPIHAFDFAGDEENFMKKVVPLEAGMFGVRCTGGTPTDCNEDPKFPFDPNYQAYIDELNQKNAARPKSERPPAVSASTVPVCVVKPAFRIDMALGVFSPIAAFAERLFNTVMYTSEDGQIRSVDEFKQTMELYSYDVGLFDFTISPHLSDFVQARAAIKLGAMIGIDKAAILSLVLDNYYDPRTDELYLRQFIDRAYEVAANYRREHDIL